MRRRHSRSFSPALALLAACALAVAACQQTPTAQRPADDDAFSSGLTHLGEADRSPRTFEQDAAFIESLSQRQDAPPSSGPAPTANIEPALDITGEAPATDAPVEAKPDAVAVETPDAPAQAEPIDERRERLVAELAALLRQDARASDTPLTAYTALAALELLAPGVLGAAENLSPRERESLDAWRQMIRDIREGLAGSADDAGAIPDAAARMHERLAAFRSLRISTALLCARVEGFGRYTPLPSKLLAGRQHPAIVYVEVEDFGARPAAGENGEPGFNVELTQELALYHDADGVLAWRRPEQEVRDFSRNRRRDFFIVQRVDLPQTLTVGAYRLKITIRDRVTGATVETILPLEVVADASLIRGAR